MTVVPFTLTCQNAVKTHGSARETRSASTAPSPRRQPDQPAVQALTTGNASSTQPHVQPRTCLPGSISQMDACAVKEKERQARRQERTGGGRRGTVASEASAFLSILPSRPATVMSLLDASIFKVHLKAPALVCTLRCSLLKNFCACGCRTGLR